MRRASLHQRHTLSRLILVFIFYTLAALISARMVKADAAPPPDPTVGGVGPYQPQKTNVQMMSEKVLIDVPESPTDIQEPKQIKVNASFTMRNQGQAEEQMQVIFPLTRLNTGGTEEALYKIDLSSFSAKVNGKDIPFTTITTPPEITITDMHHGFSPDVEWAAFDVTFPVQQDVLLEVEYEMLNPYGEYGEGFTGIAYILETGAGWYGNIGSADITLRFPYPITEEAVSGNPPGYILSGSEMRWQLKNFEPTRADNLDVSAIHADVWQTILNLRERVAKNPNDAEAWSDLGDQYMERAFIFQEGMIVWESPHFTELALDSHQKLVALRPDSGDAHYKLAEILWLSNPVIQDSLRIGGVSPTSKASLDDPAIQQALKELSMARSLGLGKEYNLLGLNEIFPGLDVQVSTIYTVTVTPSGTLAPLPTYTVTPIFTSTTTPITSSTPFPIVTPILIDTSTSSPTPNRYLPIVVIGFLIAGGLLIYRLRSR